MVGDNLSKLILDVLGVHGLTTDTGKSGGSLVKLALLDPESWRFRQKRKANSKNDGPEKLDGNGNSVRSSVTAFLGRVDDAVGKQDTNGDAKLVTCHALESWSGDWIHEDLPATTAPRTFLGAISDM